MNQDNAVHQNNKENLAGWLLRISAALLLAGSTALTLAGTAGAETGDQCDTDYWEHEHDGQCVNYWHDGCINDHECRAAYWEAFHEHRRQLAQQSPPQSAPSTPIDARAQETSERRQALDEADADKIGGAPDDNRYGEHDLTHRPVPPDAVCGPHLENCYWERNGIGYFQMNPDYQGPSETQLAYECLSGGGTWAENWEGPPECLR